MLFPFENELLALLTTPKITPYRTSAATEPLSAQTAARLAYKHAGQSASEREVGREAERESQWRVGAAVHRKRINFGVPSSAPLCSRSAPPQPLLL